MMILSDLLTGEHNLQWDYALQCGVSHAVIRLPETEDFDLTSPSAWRFLTDRFRSAGLIPVAIEPMPNRLNDHIKTGDAQREESMDRFIRMLSAMDKVNVRLICMNFMAYVGWLRTRTDLSERGGALVTGFRLEEARIDPAVHITHRELWANLAYFFQAAVPYLERYGIRLALHPDDPPIEQLGGVERIFTSVANMDKALALAGSEAVGIAMCQANYSAMGEDVCKTIRHFGKTDRLYMAHFRDIVGTKEDFHESFHDNGQTDMVRVLEAYKECGFTGPIRVDHVPTLAGEKNDLPGYASIGRLYAIGYLKGLLEGIGYPYK